MSKDLADLFVEYKLTASRGESLRLISGGGARVEGIVIDKDKLQLSDYGGFVGHIELRAGKTKTAFVPCDEPKAVCNIKWDKRFLDMAQLVASWSKDPSTRVGAVLVRPDKTIASTGFNGYAQKMHDLGLDNREEKYSRIIHAEMNALHFCKEDMTGYTLYVWPMMCCDRCSVHVIQAGITRVVSTDYNNGGRWSESILKALQYFRSCGVEAQLYPEKEISDQPVSPSPRLVHQPVYCPLCNSL